MSGYVTRISIAPVKSLGLVHPDEVEVGPRGVVGDRRFWLVDEDGRLFNNKRCGPMVRIRPEWDEETRRARPDAARTASASRASSSSASRSTRRCTGTRIRRTASSARGRTRSRRSPGEPLTLLWADEHATDRGYRGGDVSLVSARIARAAARGGRRRRARRRPALPDAASRSTASTAHAEDEWLGTQVQVGDAVLVLNGDVGRCVVTTHDPDTGVTDFDTLGDARALPARGPNEPLPFGVYGAVAVPGRVRVGDAVQPLQQALLVAD